MDVLRSVFGFPSFRPGQEELVRAVLTGRDALGVLPTGGGKSVCYQVPALIADGLTLVVTPLVSLMEDQVGRASSVGLRAWCLTGAQTAEERRAAREAVAQGRADILFVSPERLQLGHFLDLLDRVPLVLLAVDEAHCISEWGHDFRPAYRRIGRVRTRRADPVPILALTASATPVVRADIAASLELRAPLEVVRSFDRPNLHWSIESVGGGDRLDRLRRRVLRTRGVGIVYAPTRSAVERTRDALAAVGVRADAYHAGLPGPLRSAVQERFMNGEVRVVVATNAFGMGIDKSDVRFVCHTHLPVTPEAYYQEAGRAGRDGEPAWCVGYRGRGDTRRGREMIGRSHPAVRTLHGVHRRLRRRAGRAGCVDAGRSGDLLGPDLALWLDGDPVGLPAALERSGAIRRAGTETRRGGSSCRMIAVLDRPDWALARDLRRAALARLDAVRRLARSRECRRNALLRYFGEIVSDPCGRCDRCSRDSGTGSACPDG